MTDFINAIKPVRVGLLLGLITLLFGIFWVMFLKTQHDFLHRVMASSADISIPSFVGTAHAGGSGDHSHSHDSHASDDNKPSGSLGTYSGSSGLKEALSEGEGGGHDHSAHSQDAHNHGSAHNSGGSLEALAHERLVKGHVHAMGLGLLVIIVSLMLAITNATDSAKHIISTCLGVGGFLYPFSWIIMGLFTPSFGAEEAESSVMILVGPAALLILMSIALTAFFLGRTLFCSKEG